MISKDKAGVMRKELFLVKESYPALVSVALNSRKAELVDQKDYINKVCLALLSKVDEGGSGRQIIHIIHRMNVSVSSAMLSYCNR